ncbi:DUF302 domain-containing protein [Euzebya tangerina]|uniref:DUF302 domain-containing protein n=1 Tax=Euzebya tangerina TaxID=591198 RepID=UPI0013C34CFA|nr:cell wall-binding repeat-containing protein [Euzebya tangerina]
MSRTRTAVLTAFLLLVSLVVPAAAQEDSDRPEYVVVDPAEGFEALPGATAFAGTIDLGNGESGYRIEVPDAWNGQLVLYAHGFVGPQDPNLVVQNPRDALREYFISEGYAWAAASYSQNGYTIDTAIEETDALRSQFFDLTGLDTPTGTIFHGFSMGGHITGAAIERRPDAYIGALPGCGVMGDYDLFEYFTDVNLVAGALAGVEVPVPGDPSFLAGPAQQITEALGLQSGLSTPEGRQYSGAVEVLSGGERPTFDESLAYWNAFPIPFLQALYGRGLSGGIEDPVGLDESYDNSATIYGFPNGTSAEPSPQEAALNAAIPRFDNTEDPPFPVIDGTPQIPVLSLHNTGDLFVPLLNQVVYAQEVADNGLSDNLVQRTIRSPGHCDFSGEELVTAFADLVAWIDSGIAPAGEDLLDPAVRADRNLGCAFTVGETDPNQGRFLMPACTDPALIPFSGDDPVATSLALAALTDTGTDTDTSSTTVIARSDVFADGLTGSALAGVLGAPLVLNPMDSLDPRVLAELQRRGTTDVTLLGGVDALSADVEQALVDAGIAVTRIGGLNRFDTAALIAEAVTAAGGSPAQVYLAYGGNFADSVAVAGLAAFLGQPILLTEIDRVPTETTAALETLDSGTETIVVGGNAVVSDEVAGDSLRLAGPTRYGTSAAVVDASRNAGLSINNPWVVTGESFADALIAGPAAARAGQIMAMVDGDDLQISGASTNVLLESLAPDVDNLVVVSSGGAVTDTSADTLLAAVTTGAAVTEGAGLVTVDLAGTVEEEVAAITQRIEDAPPSLRLEVDHAANADGAGLTLEPTTLLIFGAPPVGTPLMQASRSTAIDLPQKIVVWSDVDGTHATYTHPDYLVARHGLEGVDEQLAAIGNLIPSLLGLPAAPPAPAGGAGRGVGLATVEVEGSVEDVVADITERIDGAPPTLIDTIDHAAAAEAAGLELDPTTLLIFGAPPVGTPLMQSARSVAIDLPQKLLVWSDDAGTYVTWNTPTYLDGRHGLEGVDQQLEMIGMLLPTLATGG